MRTPARTLAIALSLVLAAALPAGAGPTAYRPDAMVKKGALAFDPANFVGSGIYNTTGAGQTVSRVMKPKKTAKFAFATINGGEETDDLHVQGCGSSGPVKVKWTRFGENVTADMTAGMVIEGAGVGSGPVFGLEVWLKKGAKKGKLVCGLEVTSGMAPSLVDVSKATTTFRA